MSREAAHNAPEPGVLPPGVERDLLEWLARAEAGGQPSLSGGYQGSTWLFERDGLRLVVKTAARGLFKPLLAGMLRREYRVYRRLQGMPGVPRCYGLLKGRYLVLEYIDGHTLRTGEPREREYFFERFRGILRQMHRRGVAHVDLKRKDNILVVGGREPCLVDFGTAAIRMPGFRPLNRCLFRLGRRFDYNAWVKHKYRRQYHRVSGRDRHYLNRTPIERIAGALKGMYKKLSRRRRR